MALYHLLFSILERGQILAIDLMKINVNASKNNLKQIFKRQVKEQKIHRRLYFVRASVVDDPKINWGFMKSQHGAYYPMI